MGALSLPPLPTTFLLKKIASPLQRRDCRAVKIVVVDAPRGRPTTCRPADWGADFFFYISFSFTLIGGDIYNIIIYIKYLCYITYYKRHTHNIYFAAEEEYRYNVNLYDIYKNIIIYFI